MIGTLFAELDRRGEPVGCSLGLPKPVKPRCYLVRFVDGIEHFERQLSHEEARRLLLISSLTDKRIGY